ncbi:hypothetical protein MAR_001558 [Mya arenaria]|uniref:Uncharacterized protein n=1 Tax=Mya arenaria TaxID=6604 RepID=A0ABY7FC63_MYAAR|nr:hypothetical protein MAR_001558 [Mya arenaria]
MEQTHTGSRLQEAGGLFVASTATLPDPVSRSVPVTPVGNTTTSGDNVRTPPVPPSSRPTPQPPRNDVAQGTSTTFVNMAFIHFVLAGLRLPRTKV